jgi:hypothetical protein
LQKLPLHALRFREKSLYPFENSNQSNVIYCLSLLIADTKCAANVFRYQHPCPCAARKSPHR